MFMFVSKSENADKPVKLTIAKWELNNILKYIHEDLCEMSTEPMQRLWDAMSHISLLDEEGGTADIDLSYESATGLLRILLAFTEEKLSSKESVAFFWSDAVERYKASHPEE